jgi:hypothetical protein
MLKFFSLQSSKLDSVSTVLVAQSENCLFIDVTYNSYHYKSITVAASSHTYKQVQTTTLSLMSRWVPILLAQVSASAFS